ncbi:Endonuclease/exonuclease/phosphatase superfamily [Sesbania bispinosa]|nr:Endonuclease/exonuclease/phosphatase superfamily [Sesbania bispinosa]
MVFLIETKANKSRIDLLQRKLNFHQNFCVESRGLSGGLALLWDKSVEVDVEEFDNNSIRVVVTSKAEGDRPWNIIGDFNELLSKRENEALGPCNFQNMKLFQDFVQNTNLLDLDLKGNRFTWFSNPCQGIITREKLDSVIVNWAWLSLFPNAIATAYPAISSDRSPILFDLKPEETSARSFKYEAYWYDHEECKGVVNQVWNEEDVQETC